MRTTLILLAALCVVGCGDKEAVCDEDDGVCDEKCDDDVPDPDCVACVEDDGVCDEKCDDDVPDPDCCIDDDGRCDEGCEPEDSDCMEEEVCEAVTVEGVAVQLLDPMAPAAEGLCVYAADAVTMLTGGQPQAMGLVAGMGAYSVPDLPVTEGAEGYVILVADCPEADPTVMPTGTGLEATTVEDAEYPECLVGDKLVFSIDHTAQATLQFLAEMAGYTGSIAQEGALIGFALDADGLPIDGVMVSGDPGSTVYYFYGEGFSTESGTVAAAGAMFLIPGAPMYPWQCTADGFDFVDVTIGTLAGHAMVYSCDAL